MVKTRMGLRGRALHASLLCTAVLPSYLLYGYNQAVAGGLLTLESWIKTFPQLDTSSKTLSAAQIANNAQIQGTAVAIYTAAGIFGALFCIWSGDKFGRKKTIAIGAVAAGIGAIIQCSSYGLAQLIVGRVIAGLGNGGIVATVPNLQAETAPPEKRGAVVQYLSVFALAGLAVAAWIGLGCSFADPNPVAWRFPLAMPIFFVILILAGLVIAPESPRWLVSAGKPEEARETFSALYDLEPNDEKINSEIKEIQDSMANAGDLGFKDAFKMGNNRLVHRLCIACGIQMFQQLTGVNCLAYFAKTIFLGLGVSSVDAGILTGALFTFSALVSMVGVWTVDRFGRRPLLLISVAGNGICMALIAGCSSQQNSKAALAVATLFVFLFFFFFPVGFLGVTFLYAAEISPLSIRGPITSLSTATVWAFNFMTVEVTPTGIQSISYNFFIIWAVINLLIILPCVYFLFPETKGLSLEAIDQIFIDSKNIFQPVWAAKRLLKQGPGAQRNNTDTKVESDGDEKVDADGEHKEKL